YLGIPKWTESWRSARTIPLILGYAPKTAHAEIPRPWEGPQIERMGMKLSKDDPFAKGLGCTRV
ncbi:hypothetical protein Pgy4_30300, partial [Pseudomonas savastanoi pv. glycinea str. race 4]